MVPTAPLLAGVGLAFASAFTTSLAAQAASVAPDTAPRHAATAMHAAPHATHAAPRIRLVIHGGAGTIRRQDMTQAEEAEYRAALAEALRRGYDILRDSGSSLDAVVAAIQVLEDSPLFNAGKGAVFTSEGVNELDAAIMDGATLKAGAVAGVRRIKNPIAAARLVMERTRHVLLVGAGAEAFAVSQGMALVPESYFRTERRWRALQEAKERERETSKRSGPTSARPTAIPGDGHGTVGAVALDAQGRLAAGTSTGGLTNKLPGRVGDSPIVGAGTYANARCAVSATGTGEYFIRNVVAYDICARMEYGGESLEQAAHDVVMRKLVAQGGDGGVIAVDSAGNVAMPFNTEGMFRGTVGPDGRPETWIFK